MDIAIIVKWVGMGASVSAMDIVNNLVVAVMELAYLVILDGTDQTAWMIVLLTVLRQTADVWMVNVTDAKREFLETNANFIAASLA